MCRVLAYLGKPSLLDDLIFRPDNSLVTQTYKPQHMKTIMNLAGFGMSAWSQHLEHPQSPLIYKSEHLPFHDPSLKSICEKLRATSLIAHIRGVSPNVEKIVNAQNIHPFFLKGGHLAFAHNGELTGYESIKMDLFKEIRKDLIEKIYGTTDSEIMYALLMSQFKDPYENPSLKETKEALIKTFHILKKIRMKNHLNISSPLNFFVSNGQFIMATRFVFNYGSFHKHANNAHFSYHSLWYTYGEEYGHFDETYKMKGGKKKSSVIIASEPLTLDTTTWIVLPEYSLISVEPKGEALQIQTHDLDI